jgi:hypothetical protein
MNLNGNMDYRFQIFGSENSHDYDVMVFVDAMPVNIDIGHQWCKEFNSDLSSVLTAKPLNANFGIVQDNQVTSVFKGTVDEVNNALYYTYDNHTQYTPNHISHSVQRDVEVKLYRVYRCILSFFSRSHLRSTVKMALRSDIHKKYSTLELIDFTEITEFPHKKESIYDIYKVIAFQYGQLFSLIDGHEKDSYTKNGIIENYPDLAPMINRKDLTSYDLEVLNVYKERLLEETIKILVK